MNNLFTVKDKVVLITGSSQGIGYSLAKGFAEAGALVIINGRIPEKVSLVVDEICRTGGKAVGYPFDVTEQKVVVESIDQIERKIGLIDVLINNAGIHRRAPLEELSMEDWKIVIEVNLSSVFMISQAVVKQMIKRKRGKIINITSLNAEKARFGIANYCASKGGLNMLTKSMATEWGKYNIQTNAIGPGYFITNLTKKLSEDPQFDAWVKQNVPLGRWGIPDELVGTAIYLASEASNYVNGHAIYIDGGWQASL